MKRIALLVLIPVLCSFTLCFSESPSMGTIEKSQLDIEMDKALRQEAEKGPKTLIKKIVVKGADLISKDKIKEVTLPFQKHWLAESDINLILDSILNAYKQEGYGVQPANISFEIKKNTLEINVKERKD